MANVLFGIGAVVMFAIMLLLTPPESVHGRDAAYYAGYLAGGVFVSVLCIAIVYAIAKRVKQRRGEPAPRKAAVAFWTLAVLAGLTVVGAVGRGSVAAAPRKIEPADRTALRIDADSIRHPRLGFALPSPGPGFHIDSARQADMDARTAGRAEMAGWVVSSDSMPGTLILQAIMSTRLDEQEFKGFATGMRNGITRGGATQVVGDSASWADGRGELSLTSALANGAFMQTHCVGRTRTAGGLVVCVQSVALDTLAFDEQRRGLVVAAKDTP